MSEIASALLPFFGLIALGYGAARLLSIPPQGETAVHVFLRYCGLPALFFQFVAGAERLPTLSFLLTTTFATYCAFAIAFSLSALINRGNIPELTLNGLIGSNGNIAMLAPLLAVGAFGEASGAPIALIFSLDAAMLSVLAPLMMALGAVDRSRVRQIAGTIARDIGFHPVIIATVLGTVVASIGLTLPAPIDRTLDIIGGAAPAVAVFSVGMLLFRRPATPPPRDLPFMLIVKLIVHPVIIYLLLGWVGGDEPVWVFAAIVCAAMPPAAGLYVTARRYGSSLGRAGTAVWYGTIASLATVTIAIAAILSGALPNDPFF